MREKILSSPPHLIPNVAITNWALYNNAIALSQCKSRSHSMHSPDVARPLVLLIICYADEDLLGEAPHLDPIGLEDIVHHLLEGHLPEVRHSGQLARPEEQYITSHYILLKGY